MAVNLGAKRIYSRWLPPDEPVWRLDPGWRGNPWRLFFDYRWFREFGNGRVRAFRRALPRLWQ